PGQLVWATEYSDGFRYNEDLFKLTYPTRFFFDQYQGYFGNGWLGSIRSFCELFVMIKNNGIYNGESIISAGALSIVMTPTLPEYRSFGMYRFNDNCITNAMSNKACPCNEGLLVVPYNEHWNTGCAGGNTAINDAMYQHRGNKNTITWISYYGTSFILDLNTGFYVMAGIQ